MDASQWMLVALNAAAAALLLNAGVAKIVSPEQLALAIAEIIPVLRGALAGAVLRWAAAVEVIVAGGLLIAASRVAGAFATTALGLCFAAMGAAGLLRGSSAPCGCFGSSSRHPLGWTNIGLGLVLALVGPVNLLADDAGPAITYSTGAILLASTGSIVLCLWVHRRLTRQLLVRRRAATTGSEVH